MIRKCSINDLDILNKYLYQRKELNLFVISDIEIFGFENPDLEIFMDFDREIKTVYLRFFDNLCIVSYDKIFDLSFIQNIVDEHLILNISGEKDLISLIKLDNFDIKNCYFSALDQLQVKVDTLGVEALSIDKLQEYLDKSNEVFNISTNYEATKAEMEKGSKHIFVYKDNGNVVSGVSSSAESKELAMLIGVFTVEEYRRQGLALKCVYAICEKLLNEGKTVCLFYDNPNAAKMYEKIGVKFVGDFSILKRIS
ncbi:MAG: GNAT family N-acetyltransferase [Sphaerochaetaceae bacterium]|nr:GNAT family N-acetyltransferase [Sphaerochaetaceae bacterium]